MSEKGEKTVKTRFAMTAVLALALIFVGIVPVTHAESMPIVDAVLPFFMI